MVKDQNEECPVAAALDIIGERWTLLVVRDLLRLGARRFQDLELSLSGVSPNTLSARLKRLEEAGIVERRFYEEHPPRAEARWELAVDCLKFQRVPGALRVNDVLKIGT